VWFDGAAPDPAVFVRHHNIPGLLSGLRSGVGVTLMSDLVVSTDPNLLRCFAPPSEVVSEFDPPNASAANRVFARS
jgi:DNA-binding transcriptional LysR family regulator